MGKGRFKSKAKGKLKSKARLSPPEATQVLPQHLVQIPTLPKSLLVTPDVLLAADKSCSRDPCRGLFSYSYRAPTSQVFPVLTYCLHSATPGTRALRPGINRNLTCVFLRAIKQACNYEHDLSHELPIGIAFKIQG